MNTRIFRPCLTLTLIQAVAATALLSTSPAHAEPAAAASPGPATVTAARAHANGEHPAVRVARLASTRGIDSNTFIVQPPASVTWALGPAGEPALHLAAGATAARRSAESR